MVLLSIALFACLIGVCVLYKQVKKDKDKKEILFQSLLCIIAAIIPSIISLSILNKQAKTERLREAKERHEEIRRVAIDLISEVDPNIIVETVNLYKNMETSSARSKLSLKYDRMNYCLTAFNLCTEAYYTDGDDDRNSFINDCNSIAMKYSGALDIIQYLISVPDEGVYYDPSSLKEPMISGGYNREILSKLPFPEGRMTRTEYGNFVAESTVELLRYLGHADSLRSIQKELLLMVGKYLRTDIKKISK